MKLLFWSFLATFLLCGTNVKGLDCEDKIKVFVKLNDPDKFTPREYYLFQCLTSYSIREYCVSKSCATTTLTCDDVIITEETDRVSFCMEVNGVENNIVRTSINGSLDRFYGGLQLGMDVFQVEGVDPILEEDPEPNFPTWLIPFIVIAGLVIIAALVMVYFSTRKTDKSVDDEKESLTAESDEEAGVGYEGPQQNIRDEEQRTVL